MAYRPTAAVAQASWCSSEESSRNATSVSSWPTVTALPPRRAGMALARRVTAVTTKATVATMSRRSAPTTSYQANCPEKATTPKAEAMKSLSATGSSTTPSLDDPKRRAIGPSSRSVTAATATIPTRTQVSVTSGNATARGSRAAVSRSAALQRVPGLTSDPETAVAAESALGAVMAQTYNPGPTVRLFPSPGPPHDPLGPPGPPEAAGRERLYPLGADRPVCGARVLQLREPRAHEPRLQDLGRDRGGMLAPHLRLSREIAHRLLELGRPDRLPDEALQLLQHRRAGFGLPLGGGRD